MFISVENISIPNLLHIWICNHHDDVIKWKHFPHYWPFVRWNSPVAGEFPAQRPMTHSFDVFFICAWINGWINNREAGDLRHHRAHYDVTVMVAQGERIKGTIGEDMSCLRKACFHVMTSLHWRSRWRILMTVLSLHYNGVIMGAMATQITSLTTIYSIVHSGADQRKLLWEFNKTATEVRTWINVYVYGIGHVVYMISSLSWRGFCVILTPRYDKWEYK